MGASFLLIWRFQAPEAWPGRDKHFHRIVNARRFHAPRMTASNPSMKRSCPAFPGDLTQVKTPSCSLIAVDNPWAGIKEQEDF